MFFELYKDARKEWRWRLKASNGKKIANSGEGYIQRASCIHAIGLVMSVNNKNTPVRDEETGKVFKLNMPPPFA